ncbi:MAG: hypothetical protein A2136_03620 [Chloroflexi bacterium RBG_16_54_11]|nr:MAG: hypothetical protein A2136_03620 [Chloroflexi bacterium RBG_16_54_11]
MLFTSKITFLTIMVILAAITTIAAAGSWAGPLAQMDMPTETMQPQATASQDTPTPADVEQGMPSATWTSIFTGYTPYPNSTYPAMSGGGMMGGCGGMGMSGSTAMGGVTMGGTPMSGMGSMSGAMDMSNCPMMSGSGMSSMAMPDEYEIMGMDMTGMSSYVTEDSDSAFSDPWTLIGWVLLGLLVIAVLVAAALGIVWLIRRSRQVQST